MMNLPPGAQRLKKSVDQKSQMRAPGHGHAPPGQGAVNTAAQITDIGRNATPATVTA